MSASSATFSFRFKLVGPQNKKLVTSLILSKVSPKRSDDELRHLSEELSQADGNGRLEIKQEFKA